LSRNDSIPILLAYAGPHKRVSSWWHPGTSRRGRRRGLVARRLARGHVHPRSRHAAGEHGRFGFCARL